MEKNFRLRISRVFRSSFGSCSCLTRNKPDVVEKAVFFSSKKHRDPQITEPLCFSPKSRPFPSICRESASLVSPVSSFNPLFECKNYNFYEKKKNPIRKTKKNSKRTLKISSFLDNRSQEDETETLFSSMSNVSSDSSESRRGSRYSRRKSCNGGGKREIGGFAVDEGVTKVKDSFAVVKSSRDPYSDFRTSMVEMIMERQIFAARDLEQLLQCFLTLNSHRHHSIIVEVFTDIWEALFSFQATLESGTMKL